MWIIGKRLKKRHNLKDDVRQSLYDETRAWLKAIKSTAPRDASGIPLGPFMGGESPDLSDLAVYGSLNAIAGCDAFLDLCANTNIKPWYDAMQKAVNSKAGQNILSSR